MSSIVSRLCVDCKITNYCYHVHFFHSTSWFESNNFYFSHQLKISHLMIRCFTVIKYRVLTISDTSR